MKPWLKPLLLVSLLGSVFAVYQFMPLGQFFNKDSLGGYLQQLGIWAPAGYIVLKVVFTTIGLPASILTILSGALFGTVAGGIYSIVGATLGAVGAFGIARYLAYEWAQAKFAQGGKLAQFNQGLQDNALWYVLSTRLTPLLPFNIVNTLFGLTKVSLKDFVFGTFTGIVPGTFVYAWLGESGQEALSGGSKWGILGAFIALGVLSLLPVLLRKFQSPSTTPNQP
jgi:uncharacterized membrane protein YdjX (TVP38/TMEM64 family)